jgi:hypothetical protein
MKFEYFRQIFDKYSNIKLLEKHSNERRVPCGRTDGQTDRYEDDNVCFLSFANAPKNKGVTQNIWVSIGGNAFYITPWFLYYFLILYLYLHSRNSWTGTATTYGLNEQGFVSDKNSGFSLHHHVRIALGPNQTLVRWILGGPFPPRVKQP